VVIGMVVLVALAYRLIDVFLLLFIGIAIAAALQPSHVRLCRWGVPKGLAVLLIYLLFFVGLVLIALVVGPALVEQIRTFAADLPHTYATLRSRLQTSTVSAVQLVLVRYSWLGSGSLHSNARRTPSWPSSLVTSSESRRASFSFSHTS
jgi:predicted PurR-regulated permease PerM